MRHTTKYYAVMVGAVVQVSLLGVNLLITAKMPLPERGVYALVVALLVTVSGVCNFGFANALIKRLHEEAISGSYLHSMMRTIVVQSLIAISASLLLLYSFPNISNEFIFGNGLVIVSIVISLILRVYLQSLLVGLNRIAEFQISKVIPVSSFFLILIARDRYELGDVLFAWLMSEAILVGLLTLYVAKKLAVVDRGEAGVFRKDLQFGAKSLFGQSSFIEVYKVDQILVGYLLPLSEVAVYAVAKSVSLALRFVPQSLSQVAYPAVLRGAQNEKIKIIRAYVVFSILVSIVLIVVGQHLFESYVIDFIGEEYRAGSAILFVLFLSVFAYAPRRILYEYYKAINRPGTTSLLEVLILLSYALGVVALWALDAIGLRNLALTILTVNVVYLVLVLTHVHFLNVKGRVM